MSTAQEPRLTPEQRGAIIALAKAYEYVLRSLYGLPRGVDISTYVASGYAPDELRAEWEDFTTSPKYAFVHKLMETAGAT